MNSVWCLLLMHCSYLLSSQTLPSGGTAPPPIGGIGNPSARMVLVGSRNPQSFPIFYKDPDALIFTEIIEFALSLPTAPKGQEPFAGLPHLQAYRFIRAAALVELGYISETSRLVASTHTTCHSSDSRQILRSYNSGFGSAFTLLQ